MKMFTVLTFTCAVITSFANFAVSQNYSDSSFNISCGAACNLYWDIYQDGPVCASDGETYLNDCVFTIRGLCSIPDLHKVYDGECSVDDTAAWEESLWCPPKYTLIGVNCSEVAACYDHTVCSPGEGCCQRGDCPFRSCAKLQSEPVDCLDNSDDYGQKYDLKHGETKEVGHLGCYSDCHCHNGEVFCSQTMCVCGIGSSSLYPLILLLVCVLLLLLGCLCLLKIFLKCSRRLRRNNSNMKTQNEILAGVQCGMDSPPTYGEAVKIPVTSEDPPPTYDNAVMI